MHNSTCIVLRDVELLWHCGGRSRDYECDTNAQKFDAPRNPMQQFRGTAPIPGGFQTYIYEFLPSVCLGDRL